jgi:glycolate oxidase FAD binding subunit
VADASSAFWRGVRTLESLPYENHALWRVSVPPARGWKVSSLLASGDIQYLYDWAGAQVWAAVPEDAPHAGGAEIRSIARSLGGHAQLIRAPAALREMPAKSRQAPPPDAATGGHGRKGLHERLKAAFDPGGILNPGLDLLAEI